MTIESWLQAAVTDAEKRGLPELKPILEALARSTTALRAADFNDRADGKQSSVVGRQSADVSRQSSVVGRQSSGDAR